MRHFFWHVFVSSCQGRRVSIGFLGEFADKDSEKISCCLKLGLLEKASSWHSEKAQPMK